MSEWKSKRFWKAAKADQVDGGWTVTLDGRAVKTPAKAALTLPSQALAEAVAVEWDAQEKEIDPNTMPLTRAANSAIDKVTPQFREVADMIAEYGGTDLLCYRAAAPMELQARQAAEWDPILDWAASEFGAPLTVGQGVMHVAQPPASVAALRDQVHGFTPYELAAVHDLVAMTGSLVLGLAATRDFLEPEAVWNASRIDESWQVEQWGEDEEEAEKVAYKRQEFLNAKRFFDLCQS